MRLKARDITFCILSFEGPDRYAQAGGLGVRVTHLSQTLAAAGSETHLLFVGDPTLPGRERQMDGSLTLHRWCQWISAHHSGGVYAAEEAKLWDFSRSAPPFIIEEIVRPALAAGRLPTDPLPAGASPEQLKARLFDEQLNEKYFYQVANSCYYPTLEKLRPLLDRGLKVSIGFSLSFVEQAQRWDEALLDRFVELVQHPHVELVAVEPTHNFLLLWDIPRFLNRMRNAADRLQAIFGVRPVAGAVGQFTPDTMAWAFWRRSGSFDLFYTTGVVGSGPG